MTGRPILIAAAIAVLAGSGSAPCLAQDAVLFEEAATGILELAGHSSLDIRDFAGTVFVRAGKKGELRYSAATRTARRSAHPVALWLRGGTILFRPVAGQESHELILEISISEGVRLNIDKRGGKVQVASVLADVSVKAAESEVDIRGAGESVSVELEGGTLRLENLAGVSTVSGEKIAAVDLVRLTGGISLSLSESTIKASSVSTFEIDLYTSTLEMTGSGGWISGDAVDSRITLNSARGGGSLRLENTPLTLEQSRGSFTIETDAEFTFRGLAGTLNVTGFGGDVVGVGHSGDVTVENRDARVSLTNIGGPVVLKGDALNVELAQLQNSVKMELVGSEVLAEGVKGGLDLRNEFGDVFVRAVEGLTKIVSSNGSVIAEKLSGSAEIEAAGPEVRVGWSTLGRDRDSRIENTAGDIYVIFPSGVGAKVEAEADSIESDLQELRIGENGRFANGLLGYAQTPTVNLHAAGLLVISAAP